MGQNYSIQSKGMLKNTITLFEFLLLHKVYVKTKLRHIYKYIKKFPRFLKQLHN